MDSLKTVKPDESFYIFGCISLPVVSRRKMMRSYFEAHKISDRKDGYHFSRAIDRFGDTGLINETKNIDFLHQNRSIVFYVFGFISLPVAPMLKMIKINFEAHKISYKKVRNDFSREINRFRDTFRTTNSPRVDSCHSP